MNVALRSPVNLLSICTGGAGLDLAVELAIPAARTVCMVEREAFAVARLVEAMEQGLMAPAPVWSDARTFNGRPWRGRLDGVIGGIPCQPHSVAGKRLAHNDERDLWSPTRRVFVQSGAWFILIENVGGMLSSGGAERVYGDLQRLGCAVEGGLFRASEVGFPHERERLFILGVADRPGLAWDDEGERLGGAVPGSFEQQARGYGRGLADAGDTRLPNGERARSFCERERAETLGSTAELRRPCLADAEGSAGRAEQQPCCTRCGWPRSAGGGAGLGDAAGVGRGKGIAETSLRSRGHAPAGDGGELVDAVGRGRDGGQDVAQRRPEGRTAAEQYGALCDGERMADAAGNGWPDPVAVDPRPGLQPAGPGDRERWSIVAERAPELLPAVSRYDRLVLALRAQGILALGDPSAGAWLDAETGDPVHPARLQATVKSALRQLADGVAPRVDQLRMLGNGVHPLQGGHAVRTLAHRLAARSRGAAFLVRLMGGQP